MNMLDSCYRLKVGLDVEDTGDEVLIYLPGSDKTLYLNETAALVWRLCDGQRTGGEIADLLAEAYPEAQQLIRVQIQEGLAELIERGIVEVVS
jgi:hypothetical protein